MPLPLIRKLKMGVYIIILAKSLTKITIFVQCQSTYRSHCFFPFVDLLTFLHFTKLWLSNWVWIFSAKLGNLWKNSSILRNDWCPQYSSNKEILTCLSEFEFTMQFFHWQNKNGSIPFQCYFIKYCKIKSWKLNRETLSYFQNHVVSYMEIASLKIKMMYV